MNPKKEFCNSHKTIMEYTPANINNAAMPLRKTACSENNFPPITAAKKIDVRFMDKTNAIGAIFIASNSEYR